MWEQKNEMTEGRNSAGRKNEREKARARAHTNGTKTFYMWNCMDKQSHRCKCTEWKRRAKERERERKKGKERESVRHDEKSERNANARNPNIWTHQRHAFVFGHNAHAHEKKSRQVFRLNVLLIVWHIYGRYPAHFIARSNDSGDGKCLANRLIDYFFAATVAVTVAVVYSMFVLLHPNSAAFTILAFSCFICI